MAPEFIWEKIEKYTKENNMSYRALDRAVGFSTGYINVRRATNRIIPPEKLIKMRCVFTDVELYQHLVNQDDLPLEVDSFLLSVNVPKELKEKNRIKRKIKREI